MKEWCLVHPYMAFILAMLMIYGVVGIFANISTCYNNKTIVKMKELELKSKKGE